MDAVLGMLDEHHQCAVVEHRQDEADDEPSPLGKLREGKMAGLVARSVARPEEGYNPCPGENFRCPRPRAPGSLPTHPPQDPAEFLEPILLRQEEIDDFDSDLIGGGAPVPLIRPVL